MLNIRKLRTALFFFIAFTSVLCAQTKLSPLFSDNMVLQRNENVSIWGYDNPEVQIIVSGSWGNSASIESDKSGFWKLKLDTPGAGGPYTLEIIGSEKITLNNVLVGEVWLCSGQSNMAMPLKGIINSPINGSNETILNSKNSKIRFFAVKRESSIKPLDDVSGQWLISEPSTVVDFSALAYHFGAKLQNVLNVPIGLIHTSWGGSTVEAWMDKQTLLDFHDIKIPDKSPETGQQRIPTLLYNGMINPLTSFSLKGFIWYQGESNVSKPDTYKKLLSSMIGSWREKWNQNNMPFYFVQIAPFDYGKNNSAFLREAQLQTLQVVNNTGMAITMDIGDCNDIHPAEKQLIGNRLAYWALAKNYGIDGIAFSGPLYKSMENNADGKIKIKFDYCPNGLIHVGNKLNGFKISGKDKVFRTAQAVINKARTISVWSDLVKEPIAVRYAFDNCTKGTLYSTEGLPASSFRTDNWVEQ